MRRRIYLTITLLGILLLFIGYWYFNNYYLYDLPTGPKTRGIVPILMYHKVDPNRNIGGLGLRVTPEQFDWQMDYLKSNGYQTVTMDDLINSWHGKEKLPDKSVVITFDDGYEDNYRYAYPILKKYKFNATIYLIVNTIGKTNTFDSRRIGQPVNKMLNISEIKKMQKGGIIFGAHTMNHPHLASIVPYEAKEEIANSKNSLENILGKDVTTFSYPYGSYDKLVESFVRHAGFKSAVTTVVGVNDKNSDGFALSRVRIMGYYSRRQFIREITKY